MYKKVVFENYANFKGRARRKEFWMFNLLSALIYIALAILSTIPAIGVVFSILGLIFMLGILVPSIAVGVRRMQDQDKEWWNILIPFYSFYLCIQEGNAGHNQYGPDPKQ